jgi:hypothetical protein
MAIIESKMAEIAEEAKKGKPMGRPKSKPESRQTSFHLPVELIDKIDAEAEAVAFGNKSGLVAKILKEYFAQK